MLDAFKTNLSSFTSPVGYISARLLSSIWPLVVIAFAAGSAGAISGMIERGTIHFELSLPVSRSQWLSSRIVAGLIGLVLIVLVTFVALSVFTSAPWWQPLLEIAALYGVGLWAVRIAVHALNHCGRGERRTVAGQPAHLGFVSARTDRECLRAVGNRDAVDADRCSLFCARRLALAISRHSGLNPQLDLIPASGRLNP
jgi:ABC-2 family transporter protein